MGYQAWEDLLEDGDEPADDAPIPSAFGRPVASSGPGGIDTDAVLREVPALAELLRQRGELEQRMASLLGGDAPSPGRDPAREQLRLGAPPATAAERAAARAGELEDVARRELARQRAAGRRQDEDREVQRRQSLVDRGRRQLLAQQQRVLAAERRRVQHRLELAEQRFLGAAGDVTTSRRELGRRAADVVDQARAPLRGWESQREQMQAQLREQLAKAKQDPELQQELRDDPTALDDLDDLGDDLDEALAVPDAWVERIDAQAQQWSDRLRMGDTWGDRDRRMSVDRVSDGLAELERRRARMQAERKAERTEDRAEARRRERREAKSRVD